MELRVKSANGGDIVFNSHGPCGAVHISQENTAWYLTVNAHDLLAAAKAFHQLLGESTYADPGNRHTPRRSS